MSMHLPHITAALVTLTNPRGRRRHRGDTADDDVPLGHVATVAVCGSSVRPLASQRSRMSR